MRLTNSARTSIIAVFLAAAGSYAVSAQSQSVTDLFLKFKSVQTTDKATSQLRDIAKSNPSAREYLVAHLPPIINAGPSPYRTSIPDPIWVNAVALAQDLDIVEAAPALAKWISVNEAHWGTLYSERHLVYNPAATALVHIGEPAVSALQSVLEKGKGYDRVNAAYALDIIGSPTAKAVLREQAAHEPDESLRTFMIKAAGAK